MIILGVVLCILGFFIPAFHVLLWIGLVLIVVGCLVEFVPIGGRRRRWY
jgi:membrane protein implicated in regulation of membrane protease activity